MIAVDDVFRVIELERCCREEPCRDSELAPSLSAYLLELQQLIRRAAVQLHQRRVNELAVTLVELAACAVACMERHGAPARRRGAGEPEWLGEATGLDTDMVYAIVEEECGHLVAHRPTPIPDIPTVLLELKVCVGRAARGLTEGGMDGDASPIPRPARRALQALATVRFITALTVLALATCGMPRPLDSL